MPKLSPGECKLISLLLESASDDFSNHCCNDLSEKMQKCLTTEEWSDLTKRVQKVTDIEGEITFDWLLMCYYSKLFEKGDLL